MSNHELPAAPPIAPVGEPTPQDQQPRDELGANPLEALSICRYCYGRHPGACPFIKVIEWHPSGQVARVVLKDRPDQEAAIVYPGDDEEETTT